MGTPSYMPPEQAAGRIEEIDGRSDLFALGATCFRILAGRTVHPGKNAVEIAVKMAKEPAPKLHVVAPSVSAGTAAVINRALEFVREDRWPDATSMRVAVDAALAELDAKPAAPKAAAKPPPLPNAAKPEAEQPIRVRRSRMPLITLLMLLAVGGKVLQEELGMRDDAERTTRAERPDAATSASPETVDAARSAPPEASTGAR
jgi:serine/threonine protein kinase